MIIGRLIPVWVWLVLGLAVVAVSFGAGWKVRTWKAADERVAELTGYIEGTKRAVAKDKEVAGQVGKMVADHAAARESDRLKFAKELRNARRKPLVRVECPAGKDKAGVAQSSGAAVGGDPAPRVELTADYLRLHNDALSIGATAAERATRTDAPAEGAGMDDILTNLAVNAGRWAECRSDLRGFQAWACRHGFADAALCVGVR